MRVTSDVMVKGVCRVRGENGRCGCGQQKGPLKTLHTPIQPKQPLPVAS